MSRRGLLLSVVVPLVSALAISVGPATQTQASSALGTVPDAIRMLTPLRTLSVPKVLAQKPASAQTAAKPKLQDRPELDAHATVDTNTQPSLAVGGADAPPSGVVVGGGNASGFDGINITKMEKAGTGKYVNVNGGLEPPDQGLCTGNGFVVEAVNLAVQVFDTAHNPVTPPIPLAQFFQAPLPTVSVSGIGVGGVFLSDPRCYYDAATQRFFVTSLEIDQAATGVFTRAHNYVAVSKTSNPAGDYRLYAFDITDDGLNGTPLHLTCPCLGDQPLLGADTNGFYMSTNEFSNAEVFPIQPPPALGGLINAIFTLPDFRNGQAQVYAMPKLKMEQGGMIPVVSYDTAKVPLPLRPPRGAVWASLQPAHSPPGDLSTPPPGGVEYFLSSIDFDTHGASQIAAWSITNTAALKAANPNVNQMPLQHVLINVASGRYQAGPPDGSPFSAVQKVGVKPLGDTCIPTACDAETLNANDDRMNQVMLTNGVLWSGLNTVLPPVTAGAAGLDGHYRVGIQYYAVAPRVVGGSLQANMVRDGYVSAAGESVLFPSIGAAPSGAVVMGFTLSGKDFFPSAAWTRLDLPTGTSGPAINVSAPGSAPEDGFTGYPFQLISNVGGLLANGVARWGDYSATEVDEQGCIWTATEYIPNDPRDPFAGNWGTFITRVSPGGAVCTLPPPSSSSANQTAAVNQAVAAAGTELPFTSAPPPPYAGIALASLLMLWAAAGVVRRRARASSG